MSVMRQVGGAGGAGVTRWQLMARGSGEPPGVGRPDSG